MGNAEGKTQKAKRQGVRTPKLFRVALKNTIKHQGTRVEELLISVLLSALCFLPFALCFLHMVMFHRMWCCDTRHTICVNHIEVRHHARFMMFQDMTVIHPSARAVVG